MVFNAKDARSYLYLGRKGEESAISIAFDLKPLIDEYGTGEPVIVHQRAVTETPYIVTTASVVDNYYVWKISATETAVAGFGKCEFQYTTADGVIAKREVYRTRVEDALSDPGDLPDTPVNWESYYENMNTRLAALEDGGGLSAKDIDSGYAPVANGDDTWSWQTVVQSVKTVNGESVEGTGDIDISGAFWATYGTTTYAEIVAADSAGKPCFCKYNNYVYRLSEIYGSALVFTCIDSGYNAYISAARLVVTSGNTWENRSYRLQNYLTDSDKQAIADLHEDPEVVQKLTTGTEIATIGGTSLYAPSDGTGAQELYWCTYGTTTYDEITTAIDNGYIPVVKFAIGPATTYTALYAYTNDSTHYFTVTSTSVFYTARCTSAGSWSVGSLAPISSVTQTQTSGTEIAKVGSTVIYAPTVSVTPTLTSGEEVGKISVDGTDYTFYAPEGGSGTTELYWCTYGTTTYKQILTALNAGQLPVCTYNSRTYVLSKLDKSSLYVTFAAVDGAYIYMLNIDDFGEWSNSSSQYTTYVSQTITEGTEIAKINNKAIYAPEVSVTQVLTSGTEIAEINGTALYAPSGGGGSSETWETICDVTLEEETTDNIVFFKGQNLKKVHVVLDVYKPTTGTLSYANPKFQDTNNKVIEIVSNNIGSITWTKQRVEWYYETGGFSIALKNQYQNNLQQADTLTGFSVPADKTRAVAAFSIYMSSSYLGIGTHCVAYGVAAD